MAPVFETASYLTHLVEIDTYAQTAVENDYRFVNTQRLLLATIEDVRAELTHRYQNVVRNPLYLEVDTGDCLESTTADDPQVGWIYCYHGARGPDNDATKNIPYQDLVCVYEMRGETVSPTEWDSIGSS